MSYGDLVLLSIIVEEEKLAGVVQEESVKAFRSAKERARSGLTAYPSVSANPLAHFHEVRLREADLISRSQPRSFDTTDPATGTSLTVRRLEPSELGRKLAKLVAEAVLAEDLDKTAAL